MTQSTAKSLAQDKEGDGIDARIHEGQLVGDLFEGHADFATDVEIEAIGIARKPANDEHGHQTKNSSCKFASIGVSSRGTYAVLWNGGNATVRSRGGHNVGTPIAIRPVGLIGAVEKFSWTAQDHRHRSVEVNDNEERQKEVSDKLKPQQNGWE